MKNADGTFTKKKGTAGKYDFKQMPQIRLLPIFIVYTRAFQVKQKMQIT